MSIQTANNVAELAREQGGRGAFLTAPLERPVYMRATEGHQRAGYVCRLRRACYGLVDAPRAYFTDFRKYMRELQVMPTHSDVCLYTSKNPKEYGEVLMKA